MENGFNGPNTVTFKAYRHYHFFFFSVKIVLRVSMDRDRPRELVDCVPCEGVDDGSLLAASIDKNSRSPDSPPAVECVASPTQLRLPLKLQVVVGKITRCCPSLHWRDEQ